MNATPSDSLDETTTRAAALSEFIAAVRTAARESDAAVDTAKPALARIAAAVAGHDNGQALRVRSILLSLYSGGSALANVSDLMALDWPLRRCAERHIEHIHHPKFRGGLAISLVKCGGRI